MDSDGRLIGVIEDRIRQCQNRYAPTWTGFLDPHQSGLARQHVETLAPADVTVCFTGGYPDAERVLLLCLPEYLDPAEETGPLAVVRATVKPGGRTLTHSDYLGSLLGLGLSREKTGDILVREDGADFLVLEEIVPFLLTHYDKAGRTLLHLESVPLSALAIPQEAGVMVSDTVASLRLDNVVSAAFSMPRTKAATAIASGRVFLNDREEQRPDASVAEGSKIVVRGSGRAFLREVSGPSRKGRLFVLFEKHGK